MSDSIERVDVIVASPSRNFVTLKITTKDGLVGLGDATVNGRELAVASYLQEHIAPLLKGRDPGLIEDTWQYLYRGVYWRRGPITMASIGAVDMALWDILGKRTGQPVYQLLGGRVRDRIDVYRHCFGWELPQLFEQVDREISQGARYVRVQSSVPGLDKVYGISKDPNYEPAHRGALPDSETWDSAAYVHHLPSVIEAVRDHVGWGIGLLHDSHHRLTPTEAGQLGHVLEPYGMYWLEDVTPAEDQDALRVVREHTRVPLAIGEVFNTYWDAQKLIENRLIDYVRCAIVHTGGISHVRKLYALAEMHGVKGGPHGPSDVSPIALAASIHLAAATWNFGLHEYMGYAPIVHEAFPHAWSYQDGALDPGDEPGLGVDISMDILSRPEYAYSTAYLPTARRLDGTVQDW